MQPDSYVNRGDLPEALPSGYSCQVFDERVDLIAEVGGLNNRDRSDSEKKTKNKVCISWVVVFLGKNR